MNESIYRLRPINDKTIEEITQSYLWFSKPMGFKDKQDSNIQSFFDNCDILKDVLECHFTNDGIKYLYSQMRHIGVCCFTKELPSNKQRNYFPHKTNTVCIEYNKTMLEEFFLHSHYALANCFKDVEYFNEPIMFKKDDGYHIITQQNQNGILSESVKSIFYNERNLNNFFWKLLTRIDDKFINQKELRIVLAGRNITNTDKQVRGYKVEIKQEAINAIYIYPKTKKSFIERLKDTEWIASKIKHL